MQVHFLDFTCPHRRRILVVVVTRFGRNSTCPTSGLASYPPLSQVIRMRVVEDGATRTGLDAPAQCLKALSRSGALLAASLTVTLGDSLSVTPQRDGQVGVPCVEALLGSLAARRATLPKQRRLPTNWRGQYPQVSSELSGDAARPRRSAPPTNCAASAPTNVVALGAPDVGAACFAPR